MIAVLEQALPERFGGGPTSYQLVESEEEDGQPRLELRVHPEAGHADSVAILAEFRRAMCSVSFSGSEHVRRWEDAGTLHVVRQPPVVSRAGKILHIHRFSRPGHGKQSTAEAP